MSLYCCNILKGALISLMKVSGITVGPNKSENTSHVRTTRILSFRLSHCQHVHSEKQQKPLRPFDLSITDVLVRFDCGSLRRQFDCYFTFYLPFTILKLQKYLYWPQQASKRELGATALPSSDFSKKLSFERENPQFSENAKPK